MAEGSGFCSHAPSAPYWPWLENTTLISVYGYPAWDGRKPWIHLMSPGSGISLLHPWHVRLQSGKEQIHHSLICCGKTRISRSGKKTFSKSGWRNCWDWKGWGRRFTGSCSILLMGHGKLEPPQRWTLRGCVASLQRGCSGGRRGGLMDTEAPCFSSRLFPSPGARPGRLQGLGQHEE